MNIKEMTAHIRRRVKASGIDAGVRMAPDGGPIQVYTRTYETRFTDEQQREIRIIAAANGLTMVRGMPIDVELMTDPFEFNFYMPA